ncbi:MAG: acyl-CoA dehydrogenase family protein [Spirochaetales bacterium]|nr:acyl-CoA dehydrogenase family protein [Spirochaetales bacterium]
MIDFTFTEDQEMLRGAFREFIEAEIAPKAAEWDEKDICPVELFPKMGEVGMTGIFVPEEFGGAGLGHTERIMVIEEIARYSAGLAIALFTHHLGMAPILEHGTDAQKKKYLPELCAGTKICGLAVTEPGGGSDFMGQKTAAIESDGSWTVTGRKCFITNSHTADVTVITAKTGEDDRGRPQLSCFIFEKDDEKFSPGRKENKLGLRGSTTGDLVMDEVVLSSDRILGSLGSGAAMGMAAIGEVGRASMAAIGTGILRGCIEEAVKFSNERITYGKPLSRIQAIQFHVAELRVNYEAARLLLYRAASLKDSGINAVTEFSMAKYFATDRAVTGAQKTIELMGGYGVINEYPAGRFLRDALASISSGGTSEIQKLIIGGATLRGFKA